MIKNIALTLVAVATLGSASVAFASSDDAFALNGHNSNSEETVQLGTLQTTLERQGLNVSSVEAWGDKYRAFIVTDAGIKQAFFDRNTLAPVGAIVE